MAIVLNYRASGQLNLGSSAYLEGSDGRRVLMAYRIFTMSTNGVTENIFTIDNNTSQLISFQVSGMPEIRDLPPMQNYKLRSNLDVLTVQIHTV
jgi:hypothetical protein